MSLISMGYDWLVSLAPKIDKLKPVFMAAYWGIGVIGWICVSAASLAIIYAIWRLN